MSRFGDGECDDNLAYGRWEARRKAVFSGRPGYRELKRLEAALLALPHKRLIEGMLCDGKGVCAIGALGYQELRQQGLPPKEAWRALRRMSWGLDAPNGDLSVDTGTKWFAVDRLGWTETLAVEVATENDEYHYCYPTPEQRYDRMLRWVRARLAEFPERVRVN